MHKTIILTGGGTAGHVNPNLALLPSLRADGFSIHYIGSANSIEAELVRDAGLPFHEIAVGKLRRSLTASGIVKNVRDQISFAKGIFDARRLLARLRPSIVFSKGGYVSVPVVIAARTLGIKSVIHESDITPGLANRLSFSFTDRVCVSFPETLGRVPKHKGILTGTPLRPEILRGDKPTGLSICGFTPDRPVLLIVGGSSGSRVINDTVTSALPQLLKQYQVIHLTGKGNATRPMPGYAPFEYLKADMPHALAAADIVISRAGANALQEFLALSKPSLLIPLEKASRGDQVHNAESFARRGYATVLHEAMLTPEALAYEAHNLYAQRHVLAERMSQAPQSNACEEVMKVIASVEAV
ncbi:MAG: undecaprenyldiphospho-muramoylpentapeptide beta-N-acetylglucosaminyltransferase [Defluviitaleaceae bacterium]|nr:undecaprenyldiphospho-muramoylpentapeptide beta-N-acetylglucosaminyltransferase [Defluviitaleaceae bacterium]